MVIIDTIKKNIGENEEQFIWRIGQLKDSGILDLDWDGVADIINREFHDEDNQYNAASFRKPYQQAKRFYEAGVFKQYIDEDAYIKEIQVQKQELKKERQKLTDERTELNRQIRQEARKESYADMVKRIVCENVPAMDVEIPRHMINSDNDLLVHLTDIHAGIEIHNWHNEFDEHILKRRMEKYFTEILRIAELHNSANCYIVIGEILSGLIHPNLRLQNNMDLMEQFKYVSELIATVLADIALHFDHVYVYTTPGNHSRVTPKKEEALDGENMDILLPFYLKARLQNAKNIVICDNNIDPEIAIFSIRGTKIYAAHGHKDSPANVVQNFTMMYGIKPDIALLGHYHLNGLTTVYDSKVICSGSVSGADAYSTSIRKVNKPEQTVSVVSREGLVCLYDIQL